MMELNKTFDFKSIDAKWSRHWAQNNTFHADRSTGKPPYMVVIPPPNVTGILHMGHALNNTLQDILIRYKRMRGFEALWMPGTDHAGIATQNVVEKQLAKEGLKRQDLGREQFLERLWAWKKQYGDTIIHQLEKLGASCDWARARFTMDEAYCEAVRHVFVRLYERGLIYRGEYIINWCPRCLTALADEEAEHKDLDGHLYHLRYPLDDDPSTYMVVATTRPETMLGDTAVAVHPRDERYQGLIGKKVRLPFVDRLIEIIADEFVDPAFGTGAVKVTPAHDPNDFAMGQRHNLACINIMQPDAILNQEAGEFEGMDRFEAREALVDRLRELKLLEKVETHRHAVGHCYRCHTVVEPYLSRQWFVKMKPLAREAAEVVRSGKVRFYPDRWTKVYLNWMDNIRDWCISRQIWWGHRIPVWYCQNPQGTSACQNPIVTEQPPARCPSCGHDGLKQDEDVLDTWFSSWLWPFATLGWPAETEDVQADLAYFYPTAALFTAPEIIFFWVARMIMAGLTFMGEIPFSDVYIHGTVRDAQGRKMSKSLGNALDPLEIIEEYGADALRFSLIINSGQDLFISKEKFEIGRNFANKVWNAARLIFMRVGDTSAVEDFRSLGDLDLPARWIVSRLSGTIRDVEIAVEKYRYSEAENLIYDFFWKTFCDWYLEMIKDQWDDPRVRQVTLSVLMTALKVMHPFIPFVTEEIWHQWPNSDGLLSLQAWPDRQQIPVDTEAEGRMRLLLAIVTAVRNTRAQWRVKPKQSVDVCLAVTSEEQQQFLSDHQWMIQKLGRVAELTIVSALRGVGQMAVTVVEDVKCAVILEGLVDTRKEKEGILRQIQDHQKMSEGLRQRLANEQFVQRAPASVVEKERRRLADLERKIRELKDAVASLEGA